MKKDEYDVIIIGAGIGGLVCGCYLAKAGMKVLIVEKNDKPGGYCTSFERNGFRFDACAHSLGSLGHKGILAKIFKDLHINNEIDIKRYDPSDIIITPDYNLFFWSELNKTVQDFQNIFSKEKKNIKNFFNYLNNSEGISTVKLRNKTFKELLDNYFLDERLKALFSLLVLGNLGLPASLVSAFTAVKFYKQFILDGSYYPEDGMQALPDILVTRFKEFRGDFLSNSLVKKIEVKNNRIEGVELAGGTFISSKYVISDCDAKQTFIDLIGVKVLNKDILNRVHNFIPSISILVLYLGVNKDVNNSIKICSNTWFLPNYDIENMYITARNGRIEKSAWYMVRLLPNKRSILAFMNAPFGTVNYWTSNKSRLIEEFISKIEHLIPGLSNHIVIKDAATPQTLYKWTLNYKGAAYGWESIPSQFMIQDFYRPSFIRNLYLVGHWTTFAQGIPGVTYLGYKTASTILNKKRTQ